MNYIEAVLLDDQIRFWESEQLPEKAKSAKILSVVVQLKVYIETEIYKMSGYGIH